MISRMTMAEAREWADEQGCHITTRGEVGFGRECVGLLHGTSYVDYNYDDSPMPGTVTNAYHKHECVCILGRGPEAEAELLDWITFLRDGGWRVVTESREVRDISDALLHGSSRAVLMRTTS